MDPATLNKQAIACAKHYMGKTAWPTIALTLAVVVAFVATLLLFANGSLPALPAFLLVAIGSIMNVMMARLTWVANRIERLELQAEEKPQNCYEDELAWLARRRAIAQRAVMFSTAAAGLISVLIAALFMAGVIPGIILAIGLSTTVLLSSYWLDLPGTKRVPGGEGATCLGAQAGEGHVAKAGRKALQGLATGEG